MWGNKHSLAYQQTHNSYHQISSNSLPNTCNTSILELSFAGVSLANTLTQWSPAFLTLRPFNPYVLVTPPHHKTILLQLHKCNVATVIKHNVNIWCAGHLICDPKSGCDPWAENLWSNPSMPAEYTEVLWRILCFRHRPLNVKPEAHSIEFLRRSSFLIKTSTSALQRTRLRKWKILESHILHKKAHIWNIWKISKINSKERTFEKI